MITLVTLHWKRTENTKKIVHDMKSSALVKDIIVWNNNPLIRLPSIPPARVVNTSTDFGLDTRFIAALLGKFDVILTLDDDNIIPESTIKTLYERWSQEPELVHSLDGRRPTPENEYAIDVMGGGEPIVEAPICLTRCTMYKKDYAALYCSLASKIRGGEDHSTPGNGEDILLSYIVRGQIGGKLHKIHRLPRTNLPNPHSIFKRPGHKEYRTALMRKCQNYFGIQ